MPTRWDVEDLIAEHNELRDALEDLTLQFAYPTTVDGVPAYCTGGLSALEGAFAALGWDDPHAVLTHATTEHDHA